MRRASADLRECSSRWICVLVVPRYRVGDTVQMSSFCRILLLIAITHLFSCGSCCSFNTINLTNSEMTNYSSGVAVDWNTFTAGTTLPAQLAFFADSSNYRSSPYAQGISGIDAPMSPGSRFGAGVYRYVSATPGRVYLLVGYQDVYDSYFTPPPARRYAHFFGIDPSGPSAPPEPFSMGQVRWMGEEQWFYNDLPGNSTQLGGMHRCMAAWPAGGAEIGIWSGVFVYGDAPTSPSPTVFDIDSHWLFEFENPPQPSLQNAGFESVENLTPGYTSDDIHRITLPSYWVPIGGGFGQKESYYTDSNSRRSGAAGLRVYNHRGCLTRGVMQRIQVPSHSLTVSFSAWVRANRSSGSIARIGIDPSGGDDINSGDIVWSYYNRTDEAWEQETVLAVPSGNVVTVFLAMHNYAGSTGSIHYADFDDTAFAATQDQTPPDEFAVTCESPWPLTSYLYATIDPAPNDAESGIASVEYAVGTAAESQDVRPYTPCANPTTVSAHGLSLSPGQTYYVTVRATNHAGLSRTAVSNPVLCSAAPCHFESREVVVTGTFKHQVQSGASTTWKSVPFCFVVDNDRLDAVRVITGSAQDSPVAPESVRPGDKISVTGSYFTIDGVKTVGAVTADGTLVDAAIEKTGEAADPVRPVMMAVKNIGGGATESKTGVTGGLGPNNVGMLVKTFGRVKAVDTDERGVKVLYIDDGSNVACGPSKGFRLTAPGSDAQVGDFVIVTGSSSVDLYDPTPGSPGDESYIRSVVPRDIRSVP